MLAFLPRWSPDSAQIAFTGLTPSPGERIYVASAEGGSPPKLLTEDNEEQDFPYWSPDGHKMTFNVDWLDERKNVRQDVRILDLDTRQVTTVPGSVGLNAPRWSPDGRYLLATKDE